MVRKGCLGVWSVFIWLSFWTSPQRRVSGQLVVYPLGSGIQHVFYLGIPSFGPLFLSFAIKVEVQPTAERPGRLTLPRSCFCTPFEAHQ